MSEYKCCIQSMKQFFLFGAFSSFLPQILKCVPCNEALALRVSIWEQAWIAVHWHVRERDHI